jgi:ribosomal protein L37AE/L43A
MTRPRRGGDACPHCGRPNLLRDVGGLLLCDACGTSDVPGGWPEVKPRGKSPGRPRTAPTTIRRTLRATPETWAEFDRLRGEETEAAFLARILGGCNV